MKHMVFIIVSFLIFSKTFAFKSLVDCTDAPYFEPDYILFLSNNLVRLNSVGPAQTEYPGKIPCCLQQGMMLISDYTFKNESYQYTIIPKNKLLWVNGYTSTNILNSNDCSSGSLDCNTLYQGQYTYTRDEKIDPKKFFSPGEDITMEITMYGNCYYDNETICLSSCQYVADIAYNPPK
ncbi:hypothetical protein RhiirC2_797196 [Rhizophagus irregularis]|uniref:Uncharacterized protein n=1 Tax=Rhizophagus irregularis TaxID=588596 RepID=A0A2N1M8G5_9GLOM|nr:hypothetical protein RhiirC2_797196 [Rhizophagus irregularis]